MSHRVVHREPLADGDAGVAQTIAYMTQVAREGAAHPTVRRLLPVGWAGLGSLALHHSIRCTLSGIRFCHDPPGAEVVLHPVRMARDLELGRAAGDCDCIAALGAALSLAVDLPVCFVTVASHPAAPWSHVWAHTRHGDLDVSREAQGIERPMMHRVTAWGWL